MCQNFMYQITHNHMNIIKANDFIIDNLFLGETIDVSDEQYHVKLLYKYNDQNIGSLRILTNPIKINGKKSILPESGIHINFSSDTKFKIYLEKSEGGVHLKNKVIKPIDTYFENKMNKQNNLNFVKHPNHDTFLKNLKYRATISSVGADNNIGTRILYKLDENNKIVDIYTKIFLPVDMNVSLDERVFKPVSENVKTLDDFKKLVLLGCTVMFTLEIDKLYIQKYTVAGKRECGITTKCLQIYVMDYENINKKITNAVLPKGFGLNFEESEKNQNDQKQKAVIKK